MRKPGRRKARNKEKYRAEHERGIILHEAAAKALKAAQIGGKLPSVPVLQAEYEKLQAQKESLYADYGKLKKQVAKYDVIKRNIDSILQSEKQPERSNAISESRFSTSFRLSPVCSLAVVISSIRDSRSAYCSILFSVRKFIVLP